MSPRRPDLNECNAEDLSLRNRTGRRDLLILKLLHRHAVRPVPFSVSFSRTHFGTCDQLISAPNAVRFSMTRLLIGPVLRDVSRGPGVIRNKRGTSLIGACDFRAPSHLHNKAVAEIAQVLSHENREGVCYHCGCAGLRPGVHAAASPSRPRPPYRALNVGRGRGFAHTICGPDP